MKPRPRQPPNGLVRVGEWDLDSDFPIFPIGSKSKRLLLCPADAAEPFLIPGHRYLFKQYKNEQRWQAHQCQSEVIAYEIARKINLPVPPCFLAIDEKEEEMGVLIEFFYGYPNDPAPPFLVHGSDLLQQIYPTGRFDSKAGRPHYIGMNMRICRSLGVPKTLDWWADALLFDALIGNTDRHPENWGFEVARPTRGSMNYSMAPLYDNGVSLGYEQTDEAVGIEWSDAQVLSYVRKGRHHCAWALRVTLGGQHAELCAKLCTEYPAAGARLRNVIRLLDSDVEEILDWCTEFDAPLPFTAGRADFISKLIRIRRDELARLAGA